MMVNLGDLQCRKYLHVMSCVFANFMSELRRSMLTIVTLIVGLAQAFVGHETLTKILD